VSELVLISVSGKDRPGVTAAITEFLSGYAVDILDIGQAVIHDSLALGLLINIPDAGESLRSAVLELGETLGVEISFVPVSEASYAEWTKNQGRPRFILTLLARKIKASHIAKVSRVIADHGLNIDNIVRLSGMVNV
jgi:phosphoserine phosphatase